jgi:hypothetical protein
MSGIPACAAVGGAFEATDPRERPGREIAHLADVAVTVSADDDARSDAENCT